MIREVVLIEEYPELVFLDHREYYDLDVLPNEIGTRQQEGLIAVVEVHETDSNR